LINWPKNAWAYLIYAKYAAATATPFFPGKDSLRTPAFFVYEIDYTDYLVMALTGKNEVIRQQKPIVTTRQIGSGIITSSLWNAIGENNLSPMLAVELSEIFAWTVDFFGIEKGDNFKVIYDESYVEGVSIGVATVHAALFNHHGKAFYAFRYQEDSTWSFFDDQGQSLRKAFLKAPLKFSRVSSRFSNNRFHPVLKINRAHHGVDYAAPSGTPVFALGDGRITHRGWDPKGGGNYIKITHNSVYQTVYMHLSGFAGDISKGQSVRQGQLIGYVGKTGLATGPHLDFRVYKNGSAVDPLKIEAPPVEPIAKEHMATYLEAIAPLRNEIDGLNHTPGESADSLTKAVGASKPL
jgi:murein DD-endopeptidase MepM/ murein hydrolase activator NlpD